jgi:peptidyl-tRNA hydrolase
VDNPVIQYILMRNDMKSLNPGKGMAQAAHAANLCIKNIYNNYDNDILELLKEWEEERGFGTTVVLGVTEEELVQIVPKAKYIGLEAALVLDPTYPISDGGTTHHLPVFTCGYIFGLKSDVFPLVEDLRLYK